MRDRAWRDAPSDGERGPAETDLTLAAMAGFVVGFLIIVGLALWATRPVPAPAHSDGLLSAVPGRATFEVAALDALVALSRTRPAGEPTATTIGSWGGDYLEEGVATARETLALQAAPVEVQEVRDHLVQALDSYKVVVAAARSCVTEQTAACRPQLGDLRDVAAEVDRLAGDLRLFLFG